MVSRYTSNDGHCVPELGGNFTLRKRIDKIEHEGMGACARTEISQDADNAGKKVKWFLEVHKTYKPLWEAHSSDYFSQVLIHVHILQIFLFSPPPPRQRELNTEVD